MENILENKKGFLKRITAFIQDSCAWDINYNCNMAWDDPLFEYEAFEKEKAGFFVQRFAEFMMRVEEEYNTRFSREDNIRTLFDTPHALYAELQKRNVCIN